MKTLTAFWHWVDNEKPAQLDADSFRHLSDVADQALDIASHAVGERVGRPHATVDQLREHWPALRDLSLLICSGLEVMHEDVPEAPARPSEAPTPGDFGDIVMRVLLPKPVRPEPAGETAAALQARAQRRAFDLQSGLAGARAGGTYHGQVRSGYADGMLTIYTTVTVVELERFRGLEPRRIILRGTPAQYPNYVLAHLPEVIGPMLDRAALTTSDEPEAWLAVLGL